MSRLAIVAVVAVIVVVAGVIHLDRESRVEYSIGTDDTADDIGGVFDVATFTLSADLDAERTVTLWCDGEKLSSLGNSEWVAEAGHWEKLFVVDISDLGLTVDGFYDRLTVEFDGREGILVRP